MESWTEYSRFFIALLVILDPFAGIPVFAALTQRLNPAQRKTAALLVTLTVLAVLWVFALTGETVLRWLGTGLDAFRVGGGLVLLLMGFEMLHGGIPAGQVPGTDATDSRPTDATVAVVPLGIPFLAGPGAISTVVIEAQVATSPAHAVTVLGCIAVACLLLWVALRLADPIGRLLGHLGLTVMNRLFGLIVVVLAVELMASGLRGLFPLLAG